jgi:H+-translocating NAD(P) transhydrogenase subunit alpha
MSVALDRFPQERDRAARDISHESSPETSQDKSIVKVVGIPKEIAPGECRVAATPETTQILQKLGFQVIVETGAGASASFSDQAYQQVGCKIASDARTLWVAADIVLKVRSPQMHPELGFHEAELLTDSKTLISFLYPAQNPELVEHLRSRNGAVLAMDAVPRISRAQKLDALSSMANIAGYRSVLEASHQFGRFLNGQITAAGKVAPAKVMIIGAGVAGLAAIATAKSMGAIVRAFDTRPAVKEQVESLGAEFLELDFAEDGTGSGGYAKVMSPEFIAAEMALFADQAKEVDIIITTALIPGKPAPKLITQAMVESMKPGSVVVDLAAEQGGNCEVTQPGQIHQHQGVKVIGLTDLPSRMAAQSSQLYGRNLCHLLEDMGGGSEFHVDLEDEVVRGALITYQGEVTWPAPPIAPKAPATVTPAPSPAASNADTTQVVTAAGALAAKSTPINLAPLWASLWALGLVGLINVGSAAPPEFLGHLTVFVLACFIGWQVIWNVTPALHTPLMSVTNAISGIILLGGMLQISGPITSPTTVLGALAILLGTINISGGFLVSQRMLKMFQK